MASTSQPKIVSKDELIFAQAQYIEQLKAQIQRISGGAAASGVVTPPVLLSDTAEHGLPGGLDVPTMSLEELSSYADVQPIHFVDGAVTLMAEQPSTSQRVTTPTGKRARGSGRGARGGRGVKRGAGPGPGRPRGSSTGPRGKRNSHGGVVIVGATPTSGAHETVDQLLEAMPNALGEAVNMPEPTASHDANGEVPTEADATNEEVTHILVLGTPHTRKIPLRCPVEDCPHGQYKAWDRDLLLKHFKRYHADTHPNPAFNYLCPADDCRYVTHTEPSYALFTHIKNIHPDYLKRVEQNLLDGVPIVERDLSEVMLEKLPSQIVRTRVPILGVLNMEKTGMRCPLAVCSAGTQVYKSSSMKRLYEHFAKVHSFTHPNPVFIYCCPAGDCTYTSDVGNFRVYYHLKAEHPEWCVQQAAGLAGGVGGGGGKIAESPEKVAGVVGETQLAVEGIADSSTSEVRTDAVTADAISVPAASGAGAEQDKGLPENGDEEEVLKTRIIMQGSRNMVLDPLKCPIENCPKEGFLATSTATLKRHFRRHHRVTHPNVEFVFLCPVEGCQYESSNKNAMNIWRHTMKVHPEIWIPGTHQPPKPAEGPLTEDAGEDTAEDYVPWNSPDPPPEALLRVEAVQDVLNPHQLVKPAQVRCLYPDCQKPPFSGSDKVQLMRHYAHFHPSVDRTQPIIMTCPFKSCVYQCVWPAKPLYYHVESVHAKAVEEATGSLQAAKNVKGRKTTGSQVDGKSPIRIVGRPTAAGEFWCPVPGCGFSHNILLNLRRHVVEKHAAAYPDPAFIFVCPMQGCSYAKQSNYQALCTHMQREHGMKREKKAKLPDLGTSVERSRVRSNKRQRSSVPDDDGAPSMEGEQREAVRGIEEPSTEEEMEPEVDAEEPVDLAPVAKKQKTGATEKSSSRKKQSISSRAQRVATSKKAVGVDVASEPSSSAAAGLRRGLPRKATTGVATGSKKTAG